MNYSESDLRQIEDLASAFVRISDIATVLDIPATVLREDIAMRGSPAYRAYHRGKTVSKISIQKQNLEFAKVGSPAAIEALMASLAEMDDDE